MGLVATLIVYLFVCLCIEVAVGSYLPPWVYLQNSFLLFFRVFLLLLPLRSRNASIRCCDDNLTLLHLLALSRLLLSGKSQVLPALSLQPSLPTRMEYIEILTLPRRRPTTHVRKCHAESMETSCTSIYCRSALFRF